MENYEEIAYKEYAKYSEQNEEIINRSNAFGLLSLLAEECSEFIQANCKLIRAIGEGIPARKDLSQCIENVNEEMSDVFVCLLWAMKKLHNSREINQWIDMKIPRMIENMRKHNYECEGNDRILDTINKMEVKEND